MSESSVNSFLVKILPISIRRRLGSRPNLQRAISNTGWLFADRILRLGVGLLVSVWVARYLEPQLFGVYSYALAYVGLFGFMSSLGLDSIVVRDIVRSPQDAGEILGTTFVLKLAGAVLLVALVIATIPVVRPNDPTSAALVGIIAAGTLFQAFDAVDLWFQSQVQSKYTVYARNAAFIVLSLVKIGLIQMRAPLIAFGWAGLAEVALGAMGLVTAYQATGHTMKHWKASLSRARLLLRASWPLILTSISIWIYMRIDQIMLGSMVDDRALGVYSVAVRLSEVWYFVPMTIVSSALPAIVRSKKIDERLYYDRLQRLFNLMAVLSYMIILPSTLLANTLINFLYGPSYSEASGMFIILIWAVLFVALGVARETWTVTEGFMRFSFATTVVGAITNVIFNIVFIPRWGAIAAAWATLAAQVVAVSLSTLIYAPTRRIFAMQAKALLLRGGLKP